MQLNLTEENLRFAWAQIKNQANSKKLENDRKFQDNQELIKDITSRLRHRNLKRRFDQFLINGRKMKYKKMAIHKIFHKNIDRFYRDVFQKWKKNSDMLEVVRFMNEEGPVKMEIFEINKEIQALRSFI